MVLLDEDGEQFAHQRLAVALPSKLLVRREADHAEPPGFEAGTAVVGGAFLGEFEIGVLQHVLRLRLIPRTAMQRPAKGVGMQSFELVGNGAFHQQEPTILREAGKRG